MTPSVFTSVINGYLPEPHASLLNGILFGVSLKTSGVFYEKLKMVGLLHIVVLSGMNITLLAVIVGSITNFLPKRLSLFFTIVVIIMFILFVGPRPPIVRAGIMGILTLLAVLYGRKTAALYTLFLSGLFIAIFSLEWIKTISFQLSYGATLGIILFGEIKRKTSGFKFFVWKELKPSLAAQTFTVPLIFFAFHQISLIAPVSNILVSPLIAPLMIFGFLTAILGKINFYLGLIPAYVCYTILSYIVFIIERLSTIPYVFFTFH